MKRCRLQYGMAAFLLAAVLLLGGCSFLPQTHSGEKEDPVSCERVVILYHSYLELWSLAGGESVVGIVDPDGREVPECAAHAEIVGTVGTVSTELLLSLNPDLAIVSESMNGQEVIRFLEEHNIPWIDPDYNSFEEYLQQLERFCRITGKTENYALHGTVLEKEIAGLKKQAADILKKQAAPKVLHIFASGKGIKVRFSDSTFGTVAQELGADNLSDAFRTGEEESQLLSVEKLIEMNPDFIFVQFMGSSDAAKQLLNETLFENPALSGLTARKKEQIVMLPRELFHYKPNQRFAQSYQWLYNLLYGAAA